MLSNLSGEGCMLLDRGFTKTRNHSGIKVIERETAAQHLQITDLSHLNIGKIPFLGKGKDSGKLKGKFKSSFICAWISWAMGSIKSERKS